MRYRKKRRQRGYTAIELGAAIAGGLVFIAVATFGILRALDNSRYSTLLNMAIATVPQALMAVYTNSGSLFNGLTNTATTAKTRIESAGVNPQTPFGIDWVVQAPPTAAVPNVITLDYPVAGLQAVNKVPGVATRIAAVGGMIVSSTPQPSAAAPTAIRVQYSMIN